MKVSSIMPKCLYKVIIEFTHNLNVFLYLVNNENNRPYKIMQQEVGKENDIVMNEEKMEIIFLETNPTKDNSFLVINSLTKDDSEMIKGFFI